MKYLDSDILFLKIIVTELAWEGMGFEPVTCIHGLILKSNMNFVLVKN